MTALQLRLVPLAGLLLLASVFLSSSSATAESTLVSVNIPQTTIRNLNRSNTAVTLGRSRQKVEISLPTKDGSVSVLLEPHDIRSANYKSEVSTSRGLVRDDTVVRLFRGADDSENGPNFFRFALIGQKGSEPTHFEGFYRTANTYYKIKPDSDLEYSVSILSQKEVDTMVSKCATVTAPAVAHAGLGFGSSSDDGSVPSTERAAEAKILDVATEADYEFVQTLGSTTSANAQILSTLNAVDGIYRDQINVQFNVTYQHSWNTSSDPYTTTDSGTLIEQFRNYWQANFNSSQTYDVAHLFTGKDIDDNVVGIAYLGVVCGSYRYGLSQFLGSSAFDVVITAHEIGHNFDMDHDSCSGGDTFIMCPSVRANATQFSSASKSAANTLIGSASCLANAGSSSSSSSSSSTSSSSSSSTSSSSTSSSSSGSAPVLAPIGSKFVAEASTLTFNVSATDADSGSLTYTASGLPTGASFTGQTFTYSPGYDVTSSSATATVVFTVSDSTGLSDSEAVAITITNTNREPAIADPSAQSGTEGVLFTYQLSASDADSDSLSYADSGNLPRGAVLSRSGLFSWVPDGAQSGSYSIGVSVTDGRGGSDSATIPITIANSAGAAVNPTRLAVGDFDGNGGTDLSVFRFDNGNWYSINHADVGATAPAEVQFGLVGDVPVPGDYDGDNVADRAVYRPSEGNWYIRYSRSGVTTIVSLGSSGEIPLPGADYNGDGRADLAMFSPSLGIFYYRSVNGSGALTSLSVGARGDIPVICDYDGDSKSDVGLYRPRGGVWSVVRSSDGQTATLNFGIFGDIPAPADYNGDGLCDVAVFRPSTGEWYRYALSTPVFGQLGDIPVPGDYNGDGIADLAVFRPSDATWHISGIGGYYTLGRRGDLLPFREFFFSSSRVASSDSAALRGGETSRAYVYLTDKSTIYGVGTTITKFQKIKVKKGSYILRGDYDGDGAFDSVHFNAGIWTIYYANGQKATRSFGHSGDTPVYGDFDADGISDLAVYRQSISAWFVLRSSENVISSYVLGGPGYDPVAADFDGDGLTDPAVYSQETGEWFIGDARGSGMAYRQSFGLPGDIARGVDFDNDGRSDLVVWRPSNGVWYVSNSSGSGGQSVQFGRSGDVPVPGTYSGGTTYDFAVWRPSTATLFISTQTRSVMTTITTLGRKSKVISSDQIPMVK